MGGRESVWIMSQDVRENPTGREGKYLRLHGGDVCHSERAFTHRLVTESRGQSTKGLGESGHGPAD
jgi:hypothetical protein